MRRLALAAACVTLASLPGYAADLGRPAPAPPAGSYAPPPVMLWNGFYIGAHAGYGSGNSSANLLAGALTPSPKPDGIFGGGQIGYNFQFSPNWVLGIEADISGADFKDTTVIGGVNTRAHMDLFGTVRGRIGYAFNNLLLYGTGGFAWANNKLSLEPAPAGIGSVSRNHTGYAAGGGLEYAFSPNWSAKIEYLYLDFGRADYEFGLAGPVRYRTDMHTVKFGINYRFNWGGVAGAY